MVNGPVRTSSPGETSWNSALSRTPCSSSLPSRSARVSFVPYTGKENSRRRYGSEPTWSSCPCVRTTASMRSFRSRRYCQSGSTRSIPGISTSGNDNPASMSRIRPSSSIAAMFRPTSPTPPRKTRRAPSLVGTDGASENANVPHGLLDDLPLLGRRGHQRQPGRAGGAAGDLERGFHRDRIGRHEQTLEDRQQVLVDLPRALGVSGEGQLEHLLDAIPDEVGGHADH